MQLSSNKNPSYHRYWPVVKECVRMFVCEHSSHCGCESGLLMIITPGEMIVSPGGRFRNYFLNKNNTIIYTVHLYQKHLYV